MRPVLVPVLLAGLLLVLALPGCSGFSIGVRQDKEDREALVQAVLTAEPGRRFPARELLDRRWTRLFVFRGGIDTQTIEDRIGIPFPQSGEDTPAASRYFVFADAEEVVSAFSAQGSAGFGDPCLLAERTPLGPGTPMAVVAGAGGGRRLTAATGAARCG